MISVEKTLVIIGIVGALYLFLQITNYFERTVHNCSCRYPVPKKLSFGRVKCCKCKKIIS